MSLLLIYFAVFLLGTFSFKIFKRVFTDNKGRIHLSRLSLFSLCLIYFLSLGGMCVSAFAYPNLISSFSLIVFSVLSLLVGYFSVRPIFGKIQILMDYFLCVLGTVLIVPNEIELSASFWGLLFLTSLFWLVGWHIIRFFDQFPFVSFITSSVWAMGLIFVGQIVSEIPVSFLMASGFVGILTFVCFRKRLSLSITNMGFQSISLIGFFWAGVWAYFFLRGQYLPSVSLYSYYLMELFVLIFCALCHRPIVPLFVEYLKTPKLGGKTVRVFFWNALLMTIVSLFVMFFKNTASLFLILVVGFVLFHLVSQWKNLKDPIPRYKDILMDMKKGMMEVSDQIKNGLKQKGLEKEKKYSQKKKSVKKTSKGKKKK